jgi:hypothetical protein
MCSSLPPNRLHHVRIRETYWTRRGEAYTSSNNHITMKKTPISINRVSEKHVTIATRAIRSDEYRLSTEPESCQKRPILDECDHLYTWASSINSRIHHINPTWTWLPFNRLWHNRAWSMSIGSTVAVLEPIQDSLEQWSVLVVRILGRMLGRMVYFRVFLWFQNQWYKDLMYEW